MSPSGDGGFWDDGAACVGCHSFTKSRAWCAAVCRNPALAHHFATLYALAGRCALRLSSGLFYIHGRRAGLCNSACSKRCLATQSSICSEPPAPSLTSPTEIVPFELCATSSSFKPTTRTMTDLITRGFYSILPTELSLAAVLRNGQSFRWRHDSATNEWSFGWRDRVILLKQLGL